MNRNCYRVIFNAARGLLMVVGETASSGDHVRGAKGPGTVKNITGSTMRALSALKSCLLIMVGSSWMLTAQAEIVPDSDAPDSVQPTVTETANQTTQVNITAPSSGGVSRNLYEQFDVDSDGVILNNSHQSTQTQLAGWITGNNAMADGHASVILNEVNSSDPSMLQGYVEVAGQRAEVVIANPSGIQVDGAGFINVSNATLTTGQPVMQGGHLDHYRVTQGAIAINGDGLDSTQTDYTQLIARAVDINAGVWANDLSVVAGANKVDAASLDTTALDLDDGSAGTYGASIDVASLGGMYAGKIFLVGTEHGVGINNQGTLAASSDDLVITDDGQLLNTGIIQAEQGEVDLTADTLTNSGDITAESALVAQVDHLDNTGGTLQTNRFDIEAESLTNTDGILQQLGSRTLELTLANVENSDGWIGQLETDNDDLDLDVPDDIETPTGDEATEGDTPTTSDPAATEPLQAGRIQVTEQANNQSGTISSSGHMDLEAETLDNNLGEVQVNSLTMEGTYLNNVDGVIHTQQAELALEEWDNSDGLFEAVSLVAQLDALSNDDGGIRAGDDLTLDIDGHFSNAGRLESGERLLLNAHNLTNQAHGEINAGETNITVDQTLTNRGLIDGEQTYIDANTLTNIGTGRIYGDHVGLQAERLNNVTETEDGETNTGTVAARNWLDIGASRLDNADGSRLISLGGLSIGGRLDENYRAAGAAEYVLNRSALIESHGDMFITADRLMNRDDHLEYEIREVDRYNDRDNINSNDYRQYTVRVNGAEVTSNSQGQIISGGNLTIDGHNIVNQDSHILAGETLSLENGQIDNRSTSVSVTTTLDGIYSWRERYKDCLWFTFNLICNTKTRRHNENFNETIHRTQELQAARSESNHQVNLEGSVDSRIDIERSSGEAPNLAQMTTSGLFQALPNTSAGYLIQTDPAFTDYNNWLSSDFMLDAMGIRGGNAPLRLGDGFYEQQLIADQIIALTGQRYLDGYTDDNTQYQDLMIAAILYAQEHQSRPGTALSDDQIEALTTDIVWLVEQEVTLPNNQVETVMVPKVYRAVNDDDMESNSALLAGRNVNIDAEGEFNNTGTVQATESVQVDAEEINHHGGDISGEQARLSADENINIIAAGVQADNLLALDAGNDLNVITTTTQGEGAYERTYTNPIAARNGDPAETTSQIGTTTSQTIDQYAGLTVTNGNGQIVATAGNDINATAAQVDSAGDIYMEAENDLNLNTVTESSSDAISTHLTDIDSETRRDVGTQMTGDGNITMLAGNDVRATAADVQAGNNLMIEADEGNVDFLAGVDYSSNSKETSYSNGMLGSSGNNSSEQRSQQAIGSNFTAGDGDFVVQAGEQVTVQASDLSASDTLQVSADDIVITATVDETFNRETSKETDAFRQTTRDEGAIEQTAASSSLGGNDIQLQANNTIQVTASNLDADNNLMVGNLEVEQNEDGSFSAVNGEGTPDQLIVDSLALTNEDWTHETEELRGVAKFTAAAVAHVTGYVDDDFDVSIASSSSEENTSTTQRYGNLNAGGNLVLAAEDQVDVIASDLTTEGTAILSANNVNVLSAEENRVSESATSETTVAGTGAYYDGDNAELTVAGLEFSEETITERQTSNTHQGSNINAANLIMLADEDINILASNIDVEGQTVLQAEQDVIVGGHQATSTDEIETQTETTTITAGVRNAYVDAYQATGAYADAYSAMEDASSAYKDAQERVESGELAESALEDYKANLAAATAGIIQAQIALGSAAAGAAQSAGTGGTGFYGSVNAEATQASSYTQSTQADWQGSSINTGSLLVSGENATFQGSDVTAGIASLNSTNTLITAGEGSNTTSSGSSSATASANYSTQGPVGGTLGANTSESESTSTWNVNSRFNVGHLESDSDTLTLSGAEVTANTANLDVDHLTVESRQDTHTSSNQSSGGSLGMGDSGLSSVGLNASSGTSEREQVTNQTHLVVADGESSQINADHTTLAGGLITNATRDEDGYLVDHGQLNFSTNTLTVADIDNHSDDQQSGFDVNAGSSSTNVSVQNSGHVTEGMTLATLGQGNVQVNGEMLADSDTANGLNRDIGNSHITTLDQQTAGLDAGVTIDHRLLSSEGRQNIVNEQFGLVGNALEAANGAGRDVQIVGNTVGDGVHKVSGGNESLENIIGTAGIIPTALNNGGLLNQAPILLGADDINQRNMVAASADSPYVSDNPDLGWVSIEDTPGYSLLSPGQQERLAGTLVTTAPVDINSDTSTYQNATNGINNTEAAALHNGLTQTHDLLNVDPGQEILFTQNYNPTRGTIADLAESGVDALVTKTGLSFLSTAVARDTAHFMSDVAESQGDDGANFAHHSQANLLAYSGLLALGTSNPTISDGGEDNFSNLTYGSYGSPANSQDLDDILGSAGILLNVSSTNSGDFVGETLGGNYGVYIRDQVGGQVDIVTHEDNSTNGFAYTQVPVVDLSDLSNRPSDDRHAGYKFADLFFMGPSPHSNYNCLSAQCGARPAEDD